MTNDHPPAPSKKSGDHLISGLKHKRQASLEENQKENYDEYDDHDDSEEHSDYEEKRSKTTPRRSKSKIQNLCDNCQATESRIWYNAADGKKHCNACHQYQYHKGVPRPQHLIELARRGTKSNGQRKETLETAITNAPTTPCRDRKTRSRLSQKTKNSTTTTLVSINQMNDNQRKFCSNVHCQTTTAKSYTRSSRFDIDGSYLCNLCRQYERNHQGRSRPRELCQKLNGIQTDDPFAPNSIDSQSQSQSEAGSKNDIAVPIREQEQDQDQDQDQEQHSNTQPSSPTTIQDHITKESTKSTSTSTFKPQEAKACITCSTRSTTYWYNSPVEYPHGPGKLCNTCFMYQYHNKGKVRPIGLFENGETGCNVNGSSTPAINDAYFPVSKQNETDAPETRKGPACIKVRHLITKNESRMKKVKKLERALTERKAEFEAWIAGFFSGVLEEDDEEEENGKQEQEQEQDQLDNMMKIDIRYAFDGK